MKTIIKSSVFFLVVVFVSNCIWAQTEKDNLFLVQDSTNDEYGYVNSKGDTTIALGKYAMCFTKYFNKFAIVGIKEKGIVGIDRNENILFTVFVFDNGPDDPSDGLFRIIKDGKIGYADLNGSIVIQPQFDCAYPFENGVAKVGLGCENKTDGEHRWWTGGSWYTIDTRGNRVTK